MVFLFVPLLFCYFSVCLLENTTKPYEPEIDDPIYDHQNTTYESTFHPLVLEKYKVTMTPFFSPDQSARTLTELVMSAKKSIDIMIPGFSSWMGCGVYDPVETGGCDPWVIRNDEPFPVFQALINALHRGVEVRILTNYYNETCSKGYMDLLVFLEIAGADVRYYRTVTFTHNKYIQIDKEDSVISSINYSYTSITKNREQGIVIHDPIGEISNYLFSVFDNDFRMGFKRQIQDYTQHEIDIVRDKTDLDVIIPDPKIFFCETRSPPQRKVTEDMDLVVYVSPDFSHDTLFDGLNKCNKSLTVYIYQITDESILNKILELHRKGINVTILVSNDIFGDDDREIAFGMYKILLDNGIKVRMTCYDFHQEKTCLSYSHQKFWVIDEKQVWMSSGNWSPSDFPQADVFPVYGNPGWKKVNRDYSIAILNSKAIVKTFMDIFWLDYSQGYDFIPF